ncbi:hypothetical protein F4777DRAFT_201781 [Nemania sp. FL0916]|nr:hypothetical protein F4777DRAFT_201781 [Nemania sp. FL0916]
MESIHHDSEWMAQYVAAVAVPNSQRFVCVRDKNGNMMLFSLGTDSKLYVSCLDESGTRVLRDLGQLLNLPSSYAAHAFDVVQDAASKLYITAAIAKPSDPSKSTLYLLRPLDVLKTNLFDSTLDLQPLIMDGSGSESPKVMQIFMAPAVGINYCPVVFSFRDEIHHGEDLASASVTMTGDKYSWKMKDNVKLPVNAEKILALQPVVMKYGRKTISGHTVLHTIQGKKAITFISIDEPHELEVSIKGPSDPTPADPQALAALQTSDGLSDLLVGGNGLFKFDSKTLTEPKSEKITDAGVFSSVKTLEVATSVSGTTVWASTTNDGIGYITADGNSRLSSAAPVQVVPEHQGGHFAPFKSTPSSCETFVFADKVGNIAMLEQGTKTQLWKPVPIVQPSLDKVTKIQSYMTQIKALSASGAPLLNHPVMLSCSVDTSVIANGRSIVANTTGIKVMTDQHGLVTLTVPAVDIATPTFSITDASSRLTAAKSLSIDPADKIYRKLSHIQHKEDLDIDLGPGKGKLLDGTKLTPTEIEHAAATIHAAMQARTQIVRRQKLAAAASDVCHRPNAAQETHGAGSGFTDMLWSAWHWIEHQVEKIGQFFIDGAHFIIEVAGKLYRWVIETAEQVGKVLSYVFNKIMELGEKLIEWLGYIFSWGDIKDTRDSLLNIVNDALETGPVLLDSLKSKSKELFESLKDKVSKARPSDAEVDKLGIRADDTTGSKDESKNPAGNSVAANWAVYQFNHGGGRDASTFLKAAAASDILSASERAMFSDVDKELESIAQKHQNDIKSRNKQVVDDYHPTGARSLSAKSALDQVSTNFLTGCIDGVENLVDMLLKLIATIINKFKDIINAPIQVPIFSWLYKTFISGGHDLTILDVLALLIAIPATIVAKILTGKKPPAIAKGKFSTILKNLADGKPQADEDFAKFAAIMGACALPIAVIISIPESLVSFSSSSPHARAVAPHDMLPKPTASLVALAHLSVSSSEGGGKVTLDHFLDACVFFYTMFTIPKGKAKSKPGYTLRIISWITSAFQCVVNIVLHFITALADVVLNVVRGVLDAIFAAVIFALSVTASVMEIQTQGWDGKDDTASGLDIASYVFLLLGAWSGGLDKILKETPNPYEKLILIAKYASYGLAVLMVFIKVGTHGAKGDWSDLPGVGGM